MTVLAGGALAVSETTSADVTITTPSPTETSTADAPPAEVEATASSGIETPAVTIEDSSASVIDEIPAVETAPVSIIEEIPAAETVPAAIAEEVPQVATVLAAEVPVAENESVETAPAVAEEVPSAETDKGIQSTQNAQPQKTEVPMKAEINFNPAAVLAKAEIQDLQVTFTEDTGGKILQNGDEFPRASNSTTRAVGANIHFTLDTTEYIEGDTIVIPRSQTINGGDSTNLPAIVAYDVTDKVSGKVIGSFSAAAGGDIVFTLTADAITATSITVDTTVPRVFTSVAVASDMNYQCTVGQTTIELLVPGAGFPDVILKNPSVDGENQWISSSTQTNVNYGVENDYSGHILAQDTPDQYVDATGGYITNISDNPIKDVTIATWGNWSAAFWINGECHYVSNITRIGDTTISIDDFITGKKTSGLVDASGKLNSTMTLEQAQAALAAGESGRVKLDNGTWLWAYKTGDPSGGLTLDADGFVSTLLAAGVKMTDEDIAKTKAQSQFIINTSNFVSVIFEDSTINGTAINTMVNKILTGTTKIPSSSSSVPGMVMVTYYDDTSNALLEVGNAKGETGAASSYSTAERIAYYESLGYKLVSDGYMDASPVSYGGLGSLQQFEVHFVHMTAESRETKTVNETINYIYEDGSTAKPDYTDSVSFTRTNTKDLVTNEVTSGAWTADNGDTTFDAVTSPEIENYTADKLSVTAKTGLTATSSDVEETVTYKADMETTTETEEVTRTIHYVYEDGTEAAPDSTDTVTFTREATKNLATGAITYSEWTAANEDTTFDAVTSPEIENYTADKLSVDEVADIAAESEDYEITVTYAKDEDEETPPDDDPKDEDDTPADEPKDEDEETPVDEPKAPETPSPAPISFPAAPAAEAKVTKAALPSTGDEHSSLLTLVGEVAVLGAVVFLSAANRLRRKKH